MTTQHFDKLEQATQGLGLETALVDKMGANPSKAHVIPSPSQQAEVLTTAHFAQTLSPTSNVTGKHFDHVIQVFIGGPEGPKYPNLTESLKDRKYSQ